MQHVVETIEKGRVKITVTVPAAEVAVAIAAETHHAAEHTTLPGFRPGKAPAQMVEAAVGTGALLERAAERMVRDTFTAVLVEEDLAIVGSPAIALTQLAQGSDFIYTAEITKMPAVIKLADIAKLSVTGRPTSVSPEELAAAKTELLRMQTRETRAENGAALAQGDKAVIELTLKKDGVPLEGGSSPRHAVYTAEPHYIPGFVEKLLGIKEGEERTFTLPFPKDHYQKHLAGTDVECIARAHEIYTLVAPEWNDEFATSIGLENAELLETRLRENLQEERASGETRRVERETVEQLAHASTFEDFPDLLISEEVEKMVDELRHHIEEQGGVWEDYLAAIKKPLAELKLDFTPQAMMRIKVALALDALAEQESIAVAADEIDAQLDRLAQGVEDAEMRATIFSPHFRDRVEHQLRNQKTLETLVQKVTVRA